MLRVLQEESGLTTVRAVIFAVLAWAIGPATGSPPKPMEIMGERLGESIAQFTAHYPDVECRNKSLEIRECFRREPIFLAALTDMDRCHPPTTPYWHDVCGMNGIFATFEKDKLRRLVFRIYEHGVNAAEVSMQAACDAFAKKYGQPAFRPGKVGCAWTSKNKEGSIEQTLLVHTDNLKLLDGMKAVFSEAMLFSSLPSKDI